MTQQEADEIVLGMGCHPYSRLAMIDALLEGEKIGKKEQKAIDDEYWTNRLNAYAEDARKSQEALINKAIKFTCDKCGCMVNGITAVYKYCTLHNEPRKTCMVVKTLIKAMED